MMITESRTIAPDATGVLVCNRVPTIPISLLWTHINKRLFVYYKHIKNTAFLFMFDFYYRWLRRFAGAMLP